MTHFSDFFNPVYAIGIIAAIAVFAGLMSYAFPFYRRELFVEDRTRLTPLDGLRGLLCFGVFLHHSAITYVYLRTSVWDEPGNHLYNLLGKKSVSLFFCVTGFLFWSRAVGRSGEVEPGAFLIGRVCRVGPLYVVSCLLAMAVVWREIHWMTRSTVVSVLKIGSLGARRWVAFGPPDGGTINAAVTWTLQYEWGFYLLLPALALIVKGTPSRLAWLTAGSLVMFGLGPHTFFLPGMLAVYAARDATISKWTRHPVTTVGILLAVVVFPLLTGDGAGKIALVLTTFIFVPIACGNSCFGLLNLRGLRLMGIISYSVYLLHGIFLYVARPVLGTTAYGDPVAVYWAKIASLGLVVLLGSMVTYRWIEWPVIAAEKRFRRRLPTTAFVSEPPAGPNPAGA